MTILSVLKNIFKGLTMSRNNSNIVTLLLSAFMLLVLYSSMAMAQEHHHEDWELGIAVGQANLVTEDREGMNLHFHLMHGLGDEEGLAQYFSIGLGAETIITDEEHYGLMLTVAFTPIESLTLAVAPGFEWAKHDGVDWERAYATHFEIAYSFEIAKGYHIGPSLDYSKTDETEHYAIGIHLGISL